RNSGKRGACAPRSVVNLNVCLFRGSNRAIAACIHISHSVLLGGFHGISRGGVTGVDEFPRGGHLIPVASANWKYWSVASGIELLGEPTEVLTQKLGIAQEFEVGWQVVVDFNIRALPLGTGHVLHEVVRAFRI